MIIDNSTERYYNDFKQFKKQNNYIFNIIHTQYSPLFSVIMNDTTDDYSGSSLTDIEDPYRSNIKEPLEEPTTDAWVGVKVNKISRTTKGRPTRNYEIHIARVCGSYVNDNVHNLYTF
jgi:uncharacterized protein YvpB